MVSKPVALASIAAGAAAACALAWLARPRHVTVAVAAPSTAVGPTVVAPSAPVSGAGGGAASADGLPGVEAELRRAEVAAPGLATSPSVDDGEPRGTVTGRVTSVDGDPIAGATVWLSMHRGEVAVGLAEIASDGDGRYSAVCAALAALDDVQRDSAEVTALAFAAGFAADRASRYVVDERARVLDLDVELARGVTITGRVVDDQGRAVPQARVWGEAAGYRMSRGDGPETDAQGGFRVGLPTLRVTRDRAVSDRTPPRIRVCAERDGRGDACVDVEPDSDAPAPIDAGTMVLDRGATLCGRVVAGDGTPLSGVRVAATAAARRVELEWSAGELVNVEGGAAELRPIVNLVIGEDGTARALLADGSDRRSTSHARADPLGHFEIVGLAPGTFHVDVVGDEWNLAHYLLGRDEPLAFETDRGPVLVRAPGAWLIVRAVDASGAPLPGQEIEVDSAPQPAPDAARPWKAWSESRLDSASAEIALPVPAGVPLLVRARAGWAFDERRVEPIAGGGAASVTLVLAPVSATGRMRVRASFPDGGGVEELEVRLLSPLSRREVASYASYEADADGWSPPLPAGTFEIELRAIGASRPLAPARLGSHAIAPERPLELAARLAPVPHGAVDAHADE